MTRTDMSKNNAAGRINKARLAFVINAVLLLSSLFVSPAHAQEPAKQRPAAPLSSIEPAPEMQAMITCAIGEDATDRQAAIDELKAAAQQDAEKVIRQMLVFHAEAKTTRQAMAFGMLKRELALPARTVVRAVVPMLDAGDDALESAAGGVLAEYEDQSATRPPDFSYYREIISEAIEKKQSPPQGLVARMYDIDPGTALLTMMRSHREMTNEQRKAILWTEHVVADTLWKHRFGFLPRDRAEPAAKAEIEKLAKHPAWWARLYAAEIMRRHAALSVDELVQLLSEDQHELVARLARACLSDNP